MRDPKDLQQELDAAQADLEQHIGELKHFVEHKLETPKHVIAAVKKPIAFILDHPVLVCAGAVVLGAALGALHHALSSGSQQRR